MKIIGAMFLIVAVSIILIGGIAALQSQSNLGDTIINETSENYDAYTELKNSTALSMTTAGYSVLLLVIFLFAVLASVLLGAAAVLRK